MFSSEQIVDGSIFKHPFACMVSGPGQAGKSSIVKTILLNNQKLIKPAPTRIVYCYSRWTQGFDELHDVYPKIQFVEGLPERDFFNPKETNLIYNPK
jgi:hypothetical protein